MPVDFLSGRDMAAYGRYAEPPSAVQLERFFHFDERDRALIDRRRGDHNRLGFAVQLSTVRFLGTFLARPADVPDVVAKQVADELGIADPGRLAAYAKREPTHREHAGEIQREYGYRDFSEASARAELRGWLDARAWATAERPSVLFDLATARLIDAKVLLPGASVLARTVASARDRAAERLHRTLAEAAIDKRDRLEQLLEVGDEEQLSGLEVLRAGPRKLTASEAAEAFERLAAICAVGVGDITVDVPVGRLRALARYGLAAKAQTLRRLSSERRAATLLAALWQLELDATDDALILLDRVTGLLVSHAAREHKDRRYAQLPDLDRAARRLRAAVLVLLAPPAGGIEELWNAIGRHVSRSELELAAATVHQLAAQPNADDGQDAVFRGELLRRYPSLRRFFPAMLQTISFDAAPAGRPVLEALESLRALEGRPGRVSASSVSLKVVTGRWRALVLDNPELGADEIDRRAYSFCVLEALVAALDRRDVFVTRSGRFTDPRARLLSGTAWTTARPEICSGLNLDPDPRQALERLGGQLDSAYRQTAERLPENVALQIAEIAGAERPDLSKLEALDEPEQLSTLRNATSAMLPARVAFSEVLLEVCRWTGFADAFTHLSEGQARAKDLNVSICAVLLAEACNISLAEVANPGIPALSPNRLAWVSQNYVRAETIAAANELLLNAYRRIPLVQALGDGHIATVDGLRFRVPVRSIHSTGPNPRYFARGRGVTWLNYLTDQFAGLHAIVVPGTLRDSLMILDGLLELAPPGGNVLLILSQHPTAERVAGFRAWLDLGYCVTKGSKGIRIWARCAPSPKRMQAWRAAGADPDEMPRATYKLVSVFAQDQVAPLPPPAKPMPLIAPIAEITGDSHQHLFAGITRLAGDFGYTVCVCDTGPADGTCNRETREIKIAERLSPNGRLAAGIHELSHALLGADEQAPKLSYAQEELVVESISFCCCQTVRLDTSANSIPYLTSWAESASLDVLEQTVELTARLADRIEAVLVGEPAAAQPAPEELVHAPQPISI